MIIQLELDAVHIDSLLKELDMKAIDKIHIAQYVEKIAEFIEDDMTLDDLSLFQMLSEEMKQEQSTVRKKLTRTINNNEDIIKNKLELDKKPTPKVFLSWIINKVKK